MKLEIYLLKDGEDIIAERVMYNQNHAVLTREYFCGRSNNEAINGLYNFISKMNRTNRELTDSREELCVEWAHYHPETGLSREEYNIIRGQIDKNIIENRRRII